MDLAALKNKILNDKEVFVDCAQHSMQSDQERGGDVIANMSVSDRLSKAYEMLSTDDIYQEEYQQFVQNMSYAHEDEQISFDKGTNHFGRDNCYSCVVLIAGAIKVAIK